MANDWVVIALRSELCLYETEKDPDQKEIYKYCFLKKYELFSVDHDLSCMKDEYERLK